MQGAHGTSTPECSRGTEARQPPCEPWSEGATLGTRVRWVRGAVGLSTAQAANAVGVPCRFVEDLESDTRLPVAIGIHLLAHLSRLYQVDMDWLATGKFSPDRMAELEEARRKLTGRGLTEAELDELLLLLAVMRG